MKKSYFISVITCVLFMFSFQSYADNLASALAKCDRLPKKTLNSHGVTTDQNGMITLNKENENGGEDYYYDLTPPLEVLNQLHVVTMFSQIGDDSSRFFYIFNESPDVVINVFKSSLNIDLKKRKVFSKNGRNIESRRLKVSNGRAVLQCYSGYAEGDK